jgi:hypothetical protein
MLNKGIIVGLVFLSSLTMSGLSAMGVLQSTATVSTSGIIVRPAPTPTPAPIPQPPPPEPNLAIEVYSSNACTSVLTSVVWGELLAGGSATKTVYIKNNGDTGVILSLGTENWNPSSASDYMSLTWNYNNAAINPGEVRQVTLTLSVDGNCPELSGFGFDIVIIGS